MRIYFLVNVFDIRMYLTRNVQLMYSYMLHNRQLVNLKYETKITTKAHFSYKTGIQLYLKVTPCCMRKWRTYLSKTINKILSGVFVNAVTLLHLSYLMEDLWICRKFYSNPKILRVVATLISILYFCNALIESFPLFVTYLS